MSLKLESNWTTKVADAEHYKAIGQTEIYLHDRDIEDRPWNLVTGIKPGGTHRLDFDTSVSFTAAHRSGLSFRWSLDIEDYEANGHGYYVVQTELLAKVLGWLNFDARQEFSAYLRDCAMKLRENAQKFTDIAAKEYGDAALLDALTRDYFVEPAKASTALRKMEED